MQTRLRAWAALVVAGMSAAMWVVWHGNTLWDTDERLSRTPLRVGYALEAPFVYLDADGRVSGESPQVLRALLRRMGEAEPVWVHQEFSRLSHELLLGRIDVIAAGMFITPERSRRMAFTRPTVAVRNGLMVKRGNPNRLCALADLIGQPVLKLAVIDGAVEAELALASGMAGTQLLTVPDALTGVAAVRTGKAAALALSAPSLRWLSRSMDSQVEVLECTEPATVERVGYPAFAFRLGDARRDAFDHAIASFIGSEEHLRIERDHGMTADDVELARRWMTTPVRPAASAHKVALTSGVRS